VISHRNTPSKTSFRHIAKSQAEGNGAIAASLETTASKENWSRQMQDVVSEALAAAASRLLSG
jgi:hypothetical protein